jgi:hypothetical protein
MSDKVIPNEDELVQLIQNIKLEQPEFGIKKVTQEIVEREPQWQVSEKRVKKYMQLQGLTQGSSIIKSGVAEDPSIPVSFIDPKLDLKAFEKVVARMVDPVTGKGLFAAEDVKKDDIFFTEAPFVYFPPWEGFNLARGGNACGLCCKPLLYPNSTTQHCGKCGVYYCSKQCRSTAWDTFHQLECTNNNPKAGDFINFCQMENWQAPMAVARIYAYYILANQRGELEKVMGHIDAFATVDQAERQAKETEWIFMVRRERYHLCKHVKSDGWDGMCSIEIYTF